MKKSTITDLPADIKAAVHDWKDNKKLCQIIEESEAGEFHDYKNKKYACGKVQVRDMLIEIGDDRLRKIIIDIQNGAYDESPDEEDKALMKKDWLHCGGTLESYNRMFGGGGDK